MTLHTVWVVKGLPDKATALSCLGKLVSTSFSGGVRALEDCAAVVVVSHVPWHRSPTPAMTEATLRLLDVFAGYELACGNELALDEIRIGQYTLSEAIADGEFLRCA